MTGIPILSSTSHCFSGSRRRRKREWAVAAAIFLLGAVYVSVLWSNPFGEATYRSDSDGYIDFDAYRTAGYPLFLDIARAFFGTVEAASSIQLLLAAVAFVFLGWSLHQALRAPLLALVVVVALFGNPEIARLHPVILTDSAFVSLLCVMSGAMAMLVARPSAAWAMMSAMACGLAVAVRPAGVSLLPIWPILFWFIWPRCAGRRLHLVATVVVTLAICGLVETAAWKARHGVGTERPNLSNLHLFAKALMMEPVVVAQSDELDRFLDVARRRMAAARDLVAGAPDSQIGLVLRARYELEGQQRLFRDEVEALAKRRGVSVDRLKGEIGWRAVLAAPSAWAKNVAVHYVGLWNVYELLSEAAAQRYAAYIQAFENAPLLGTERIPVSLPSHFAALPIRVMMLTTFLATGLAMGTAPCRRWSGGEKEVDNGLVLAALCGFLAHGHYLLVAMFGRALARYSLTMWPLLLVCGLLVSHYVWRRKSLWL